MDFKIYDDQTNQPVEDIEGLFVSAKGNVWGTEDICVPLSARSYLNRVDANGDKIYDGDYIYSVSGVKYIARQDGVYSLSPSAGMNVLYTWESSKEVSLTPPILFSDLKNKQAFFYDNEEEWFSPKNPLKFKHSTFKYVNAGEIDSKYMPGNPKVIPVNLHPSKCKETP